MCLFKKERHICRHVQLEIALEIPALNEWKIETNNSATQGIIRA